MFVEARYLPKAIRPMHMYAFSIMLSPLAFFLAAFLASAVFFRLRRHNKHGIIANTEYTMHLIP